MSAKIKLLVIMICFLISCKKAINKEIDFNKGEINYKYIEAFLKDSKPELKVDSLDAILVLSNNGCQTCNTHFAGLISEFINSDHNLIINTADGTRVDISAFLDDTLKNVIQDDRNLFYPEAENSFVVFLTNNKVDTIIQFTSESIEANSEYILSRLHNR